MPASARGLVVTREPVSPEQLLGHLRGRVPETWSPKVITFADELPRTTVGKVDKGALRTRFGDADRKEE